MIEHKITKNGLLLGINRTHNTHVKLMETFTRYWVHKPENKKACEEQHVKSANY